MGQATLFEGGRVPVVWLGPNLYVALKLAYVVLELILHFFKYLFIVLYVLVFSSEFFMVRDNLSCLFILLPYSLKVLGHFVFLEVLQVHRDAPLPHSILFY